MVASNEAQNNSQSSLHTPGPGDTLAASKTSFELYRVHLSSRFDNITKPGKRQDSEHFTPSPLLLK
jgi:hypothetical protein